MLKTNPHRSRRSRVLYLLPMIALALSAFATSEFQTASDFIEQTVKATPTTFTLKGTVPNELNVDHYLIYINKYDQKGLPEPIDSVYVKNGKFEYSEEFDQPYSGMLRAVLKDGSLGEQFQEIFFVPGENCKMDIYGTKFEDFNVSGSKFYRDWTAFKEFYLKERQKAIDLQGAGDKAYYAAIADYNRKHKDEEGCIMYQYMWLSGSGFDFSIADGIQQGRFKRYIQHRMIQYDKVSVIDIRIDADGKLYSGKNHAKPEPIQPADLMKIISQNKDIPTIINLESEKPMDGMENIVKEAARKNNLLKINYSVINKE